MSPSKRMMSASRAVIVVVLVGASAWTTGALAHPIAVARGAAVIDGARVRITLREAGESLIHEMPVSHARGDFAGQEIERAFARRAGNMVSRLEVRDESGRLLAGRLTKARLDPVLADAADSIPSRTDERIHRVAWNPPEVEADSDVSWRGARATYELEYVGQRPLTHVTIRQASPEDAIIPTQFALRVQEPSVDAERFVRLTSAGNAETLDLSPPPSPDESLNKTCEQSRTPAADVPASMRRHRFKCIQAVVRREPGRVLVEAYLPLTLLDTWRPIDREQTDFVTPVEQRSACEAAVRLLQENTSLIGTTREAAAIRPAVLLSALLGPDRAYMNGWRGQPGDRVMGAWSARVAVRMEFNVQPTESVFKLDWRLFNPAVLTADLLIVREATSSGMAEATEHQVTTYNPTVVLKMPVASSPKKPIARSIEPGA